ncbi:hypothetical protein, partial [Parasphingorhabdus sp.]|uniref:hypothetical protein n=1 Tax=Parasphingorhabdus sp. TaxID=2709688 RepID=UPI00300293BF
MDSDKTYEIPISDAISHGVPANDLRREAADQHGQITRWLFASLLAINGGAVLASAQLAVSAHQIQ